MFWARWNFATGGCLHSAATALHGSGITTALGDWYCQGTKVAFLNASELSDGRILTLSGVGTARIWPGSPETLIAWARDVHHHLNPLTEAELCDVNLLPASDCAR